MLVVAFVAPSMASKFRAIVDIFEQDETADCDVGMFFDEDAAKEATDELVRILQEGQGRPVTVSNINSKSLIKPAAKHCVVDLVFGSDKFIAEHMEMGRKARDPTSASIFYLVVPTMSRTHNPRAYSGHDFR